MIPTAAPTIDRIGAALKNLALVASNDTTVLQQLTAANLLLMALVTSLMMANKKLADALARNKGVMLPAAAPTTGKEHSANKAFPRELLLDPRSLGQPKPHKCNLGEQGCSAQGQCDDRQHNGR